MRFLILIKATKDTEAGVMPDEKLFAEMGKYNEELVKAGILLGGEGLHPSSQGARVRLQGDERTVTFGPFAETNQLIAGFWIWQVKSLDEAIAWVKRCPNPTGFESEIEIRRIFEADDFGETLTPELREQEERLRAQTFHLDPPRYEEGRELLIAGLNATYTFAERNKIPAQWARMAPHLGNTPGQQGTTTYGVCWNYQPGCGFDYLSGVEVNDTSKLPEGFTHVRIPATRYAVFTHREHISSLGKTLDAIWSKWLPNSGHQPANSPSFERYTERFDPQSGLGEVEIWIPLQA